MSKKLTYSNFKIGEYVMCIEAPDFFEEHITVGKSYEIVDLEFRFPDSICIKTDSGLSMFMKIDLFDKRSANRDKKIDSILENK